MNMYADIAPPPRRLARLWHVVRDGLPSVGRYRRYIAAMSLPLGAIWLVTAAYLAMAPDRYESRMSLILPGSGPGSTLNLESIGQASGNASSPFSSSTLSPTENYKRLLLSDPVLGEAARKAGEDEAAFPQPSIKLIDQTNLIEVTMPAGTPQVAQKRMRALRGAFLQALDNLRQDEARAREESDAEHIAQLQRKVESAQRALLDFQGKTGLVSLDQFASRISALDELRTKERDRRVQLSENSASEASLARSLGVSLPQARQAMLLKADPVFQELLTRYARSAADGTQQGATLGSAHGKMEQLTAEGDDLREAMAKRGSALTRLPTAKVLAFADLSVSEGRARLMESYVLHDSDRSGSAAALAEIHRQIGQEQGVSQRLVKDASQLADLVRDVRVTEAVFSSALARLDTNKADPFASYPLVQTLEAPSLPRSKAAPSPLIALAGAMAASILVIFGFLLLWLRQPIIRKLLPNA
ncbi:hypothetical protein [Altererythrobacter fulvus]|uniref:GumC family protein n=1 Tax=Caenibius fulvus TaxID=2126012 RepID=UPI00301744C8